MHAEDDFFADADAAEAEPAEPLDVDANGAGPPAARTAPPARGTVSSLRDALTGGPSGAPRARRPDRPPAAAPPTAGADGDLDETGARRPPRPILRSEVHHRPPTLLQRVRQWLDEALMSSGERAERDVDGRLAQLPRASRTNLIVFAGPRGGVGKTTVARAVGGLLAEARCGTVAFWDADQDYGPAADLVPDGRRSPKTIMDLLADFEEPPHPPELRPYLSSFPDGLQLLAAPATRKEMSELIEEDENKQLKHLNRVLELLRGVDVLLMDCAGGIGKVQLWALERADQAVVFATPDFVAANNVARVLSDEDVELPDRTTLVLNNPRPEGRGDLEAIERHFARHSFEERIALPFDQRLRDMLDQGTYDLAVLGRRTRLPLKRLAAAVGEGLQ
jgi:MinD-like ATPase involved in chromosome partitioning or flagellar assembly